MHSKLEMNALRNFSDNEIRPLTPKPFLAGDVGKRNEALFHSINGNDIKTNSALSHNFNGEVSKTSVIKDIIIIIKRKIVKE